MISNAMKLDEYTFCAQESAIFPLSCTSHDLMQLAHPTLDLGGID